LKEKVISVEEKKERSKLLMNKGKNLVVEGKAKEALTLYNQAIILNPENSEAHNHKGFVLDEVGQYEEALFHYNAAININPNYSIAYNNKGVTLKKLKRYDEAIEMYKQAQYLDPHNPNIQRNIQKAQELFSQEIKQKSKDFVERGKELQTEKKYDEALPYFTEAGELDQVNEDAFIGKG